MLCNLNSFSLFISLSQFDKQEQICRSVIVMPHALQYPSNISIPLRLSGHWQINHQHRSHSQTFPSHSQTFHISTVTSAKQATQTIPRHTNWLLEHQTWQILQGLQDITDIYPTLQQEGTCKKKKNPTSLCTQMLLENALNAFIQCKTELCKTEKVRCGGKLSVGTFNFCWFKVRAACTVAWDTMPCTGICEYRC